MAAKANRLGRPRLPRGAQAERREWAPFKLSSSSILQCSRVRGSGGPRSEYTGFFETGDEIMQLQHNRPGEIKMKRIALAAMAACLLTGTGAMAAPVLHPVGGGAHGGPHGGPGGFHGGPGGFHGGPGGFHGGR